MTSPDTSGELAKYRDRVGSSTFYFDRIDEMGREDLLGLIGWMMADKEHEVKMRDDRIAFERDLSQLRFGKRGESCR